ncbi:single-stranded-DNA-specific exonuclease RecJ [Candidatus Kaiserbacteria bacterium]|nr:single-stranded-DNA-specific exonuclease RecJ [Candidatus Kaiserbacteria bacterium]
MVVSDLVRELLQKRGITETEAVEKFLAPDYERDTHDPFLLKGMEKATQRLLSAIEQGERIAVYADFDCDGIPGAALLSDFFKKIGYENFEVYIPHRDREGYGFHTEAIEQLSADKVSLIITVDVGTNALEAVSFAKAKGIAVIVTDHHEVTGALPECVAVLNPKLGEYPFRDLCGAAVAWKLVQALLIEGKKQKLDAFARIPDGWEKWLLDLVAIATVADLVPLVGENRVLAHFGLKVLRQSKRTGVTALCNALRLRKSEITEETIAFSFAPRINAASRMDEPEFAFRLLVTTDQNEAERIAAHLEELNARRKTAVAVVVKAAKRTARTRFRSDERIIVIGSPDWKPALLGLAANSIMEERGGVVCLWGRDANGRIKGSCRSDGSISVVDLFAASRDAFVEFGGHRASGGFTVSHERIHTLHESLVSASANIPAVASDTDESVHDALITLPEVTERLLEEVSKLAPFGIGNPKPRFLVSSITVSSVRIFGRDRNHVEVIVSCERTGISARAFDFFNSPEGFMHTPSIGGSVRLLATVERDTFRGGLALRLVDVLA